MDLQDLIDKANAYVVEYPSLRLGQAYFNALLEIDQTTANEIRSTSDDPFYDDSKVRQFLDKVGELWNV